MTGAGLRNPEPCPSEAAYQRHVRASEPVDLGCRVAMTAARRKRWQWRKARGQVEQAELVREAVRVLAEAMGTWPAP